MTESKIFIIGLPRTATTSVCLAMLELGFKTAHTAYTKKSMADAQVIADTPVFCDYQTLDRKFPNAKFIYLTREFELWLPSIRQLLARMFKNLTRTDGGSNPHLRRCYGEVFAPLTEENIQQDEFLYHCYLRHYQTVIDYFKGREQDLLTIDVSIEDSFNRLLCFLDIDNTGVKQMSFERINMGGKVTAWNKIKHPLKIESTNKGKIELDIYL